MGIGVQTFNASGVIDMDTTTQVGRLLKIIDASASSGSVNIAGLANGVGFAVPILYEAVAGGTGAISYAMQGAPYVSFNGMTMSWTRNPPPTNSSLGPAYLIVGVR